MKEGAFCGATSFRQNPWQMLTLYLRYGGVYQGIVPSAVPVCPAGEPFLDLQCVGKAARHVGFFCFVKARRLRKMFH